MTSKISIRIIEKDNLFEGFPEQIINMFSSNKWSMFSMFERPWLPPTDIYETKEQLVIKMEIAGVQLKDIEIILDGQTLVVSGYRHEEPAVDKENYHMMEIHYGKFDRVFVLPKNIVAGSIQAFYKDGFLKIIVPKRTILSATKIPIE